MAVMMMVRPGDERCVHREGKTIAEVAWRVKDLVERATEEVKTHTLQGREGAAHKDTLE
jgi:hypothetical protein